MLASFRRVLTPTAVVQLLVGWLGFVALTIVQPVIQGSLTTPLLFGLLAAIVAFVSDRYYRGYSYLGSDAGTRRPSNDCSRFGYGGGYDHYESGGWYRPACSRVASGFVTSQPIGCIRLHSDLISVAHCGVCLTAGGRCGRHL